ncbi:MAG: S8 family serine peptidase [Armatimonadetes bacterium]|nr:S8 family serine peptidase [Armatimonadota bacterium]
MLRETAREARSLAGKLEPGEFVPGRVLVKFRGGIGAESLKALAADYGAAVKHQFSLPAAMAGSFSGTLALLDLRGGLSTPQAMAALARDPRVEYAESDDIVRSASQGSFPAEPPRPAVASAGRFPDDLAEQQWSFHNVAEQEGRPGADIDAPLAWTIATGDNSDNGPIVAVLDTGIDSSHEDLQNNMWKNPGETPENGVDDDGNELVDDVHGPNFLDNNGNPMDEAGTGTHYAGIIAAQGNNGIGIAGLNWKGRLMAVKFLGSGGGGSTSDAIKGLLYATAKGARITSNSWTTKKYNQALADVMRASPALHVCAAGDDGSDNDERPAYPASLALENVISVAASDPRDRLAWFSNRGARTVHLAAPGQDIYSTAPQSQLAARSGTGAAAPHVAGVAALIASRYPGADNQAIKNRLLTGVDPLPAFEDRLQSGGRLNAYKALEDDQLAPATPADFRVTDVAPNAVSLGWTATGDDANVGQAFRYDVRYADRPIAAGEPGIGEIPFELATPVGVDRPAAPGSAETARLELPPSGQERTLYFALQVSDNVGNRSDTAVTRQVVAGSPVVFEDRMDSGNTRWTAEGSWALVDSRGRGQVWTDSPDGDYAPGCDQSLTSVPINLKDWKDLALHFDARLDTEPRFDRLLVEVHGKQWWSTRWRTLAELDGARDWSHYRVDLSDYKDQEVRIRFRFVSDDSRHRDGAWLDNVVITGARQPEESRSVLCPPLSGPQRESLPELLPVEPGPASLGIDLSELPMRRAAAERILGVGAEQQLTHDPDRSRLIDRIAGVVGPLAVQPAAPALAVDAEADEMAVLTCGELQGDLVPQSVPGEVQPVLQLQACGSASRAEEGHSAHSRL